MSKWPKGINPDLPEPREWENMERGFDPLSKVHHTGMREEWVSKYYQVLVRRKPGRGAQCISLMITNADQSARRDWREFQRIKNEIVGEDWVGYEIYPPESKAVDPSNAFFLWCYPKAMLPKECSMSGPRHFTQEQAVAPQRGGEK